MTDDPAATLTHFLAIPADRISRDLLAAGQDDGPLVVASERYLATPVEEVLPPAVVADFWHAQMLRVLLMKADRNIPDEMALHWGSYIAHAVAEAACDVAEAAGELARLDRDVGRTERGEELEVGECWPPGEGPGKYESLRSGSDELFDKITQTVVVHVLRRYGLRTEADLFERDRAAFDAKAEVGRKLFMKKH